MSGPATTDADFNPSRHRRVFAAIALDHRLVPRHQKRPPDREPVGSGLFLRGFVRNTADSRELTYADWLSNHRRPPIERPE
ncbi:hypothetical protein EVAR_18377_1 [Eumeta japonica]|uniref:Uncharacterized protein n=1 Tax=Eumeta variegata TaxID=151549 RepID=A0A4C1UV53_EUMVA|nr:hypothetical protein EVAR_18377_1 [Eumeta japonica]